MSTRLAAPSNPPTRATIELWLREIVAELATIPAASIDVHAPFARFGVDSATALIVTEMLIDGLKMELDPALLYEHDTIDALASYLERRVLERDAEDASK